MVRFVCYRLNHRPKMFENEKKLKVIDFQALIIIILIG